MTKADEIKADIAELQRRLAKAEPVYEDMLRGWIWILIGDLAATE